MAGNSMDGKTQLLKKSQTHIMKISHYRWRKLKIDCYENNPKQILNKQNSKYLGYGGS